MTRLISFIANRKIAASIVVVAGVAGLLLMVTLSDGDDSTASAQRESAGTGGEETASTLCVAPGVSTEKQQELVAQLRAAGEADDTRTRPPARLSCQPRKRGTSSTSRSGCLRRRPDGTQRSNCARTRREIHLNRVTSRSNSPIRRLARRWSCRNKAGSASTASPLWFRSNA